MFSSSKWNKYTFRLGCGLVLVVNLFLFLLPVNYTPTNLSPERWLLIMLILVALIWISLTTGVGLVIVSQHQFFQQIKGPLLLLAWLALSLHVHAYLDASHQLEGLVYRLFVLNMVWLLALPFAIGLALLVYLTYRDKSVRLIAITLLFLVWRLALHIRQHGADQIFQDAALNNLPNDMLGIFCLTGWLLILGPISFLGHSLRLIYRELSTAESENTLCKSEVKK